MQYVGSSLKKLVTKIAHYYMMNRSNNFKCADKTMEEL